jgi:hypothetical protein
MALSGKGAEGLDTAARAMAMEDAASRRPEPQLSEPAVVDEQPAPAVQDP